MKIASFLAGLCSVAHAIIIPNPTVTDEQAQAGCEAPVYLDASTNVFKDYKLHPNSIYRKRAEASAEIINDAELKSRALKIANAGQFVWMQVLSLFVGEPRTDFWTAVVERASGK